MSRSWDTVEPPLAPWLRSALRDNGWDSMTPVQASTVPLFLKHKDVVVEAVTGSGKTLAYLVPLIERLLRVREGNGTRHRRSVGALVVCPTRELAAQIHAVLRTILICSVPNPSSDEDLDDVGEARAEIKKPLLPGEAQESEDEEEDDERAVLRAQLLVGGMSSVQQDIISFRKRAPDVLIGTPGRVDDFMASAVADFRQLEVLIMDEADRLLDMGFAEALDRIVSRLPKQRRTGLFSATMTDAVSSLVRTGLRNPVKIVVQVKASASEIGTGGEAGRRAPTSLQLQYTLLHPREKLVQLHRVLKRATEVDGMAKAIVYLPTCAAVDYFAPLISEMRDFAGFALVPLHGKQGPSVRQRNFARFVAASVGSQPSVLLTTDLAARGLDVPDVDLVIQLDPPADPAQFAHRCGRAGRAGRQGRALVYLNHGREQDFVEFLNVKKTPLTQVARLDEACQYVEPLAGADSTDGGESSGSAEQRSDAERASVSSFNARLRAIVLQDRDLIDRAARAYVSYVRMYQKHQLPYIFRLQDLDLVGAALAYGLPRLPRMPEIERLRKKAANASTSATTASVPIADVKAAPEQAHSTSAQRVLADATGEPFHEVDTTKVPYLDAARESKRQRELETRAAARRDAAAAITDAATSEMIDTTRIGKAGTAANAATATTTLTTTSWSKHKEAREVRLDRRDKRKRKCDAVRGSTTNPAAAGTTPEVEKGGVTSEDNDDDEDDWKALVREKKSQRKQRQLAKAGRSSTKALAGDSQAEDDDGDDGTSAMAGGMTFDDM